MRTILLFVIIGIFCQDLAAQDRPKKGFIGITIGPAFPVGAFASKTLNDNTAGLADHGYCDTFINGGYIIGKNFGVTAAIFYDEHTMTPSTTKDWWQVVGITLGPMVTYKLFNKCYTDLKARFGYIGTTRIIDTFGDLNSIGSGLGLDLRASVRYDVFKRWCAILETGYVASNQKFGDGHKQQVNILVSGIGIGFRF